MASNGLGEMEAAKERLKLAQKAKAWVSKARKRAEAELKVAKVDEAEAVKDLKDARPTKWEIVEIDDEESDEDDLDSRYWRRYPIWSARQTDEIWGQQMKKYGTGLCRLYRHKTTWKHV